MNFDHLQHLTVDKKAEVAQQNMMQQVIDAGWGQKKWQGMWGKLIKLNRELNGFCPEHLETIIRKAFQLEKEGKCNARGFVRNRLQKADWRKWL